ncbi:hypothetical protein ECAE60S_04508 [Eoetvoesiella caeni]
MTMTTLIAVSGLLILFLGLAGGSAYTHFHQEGKQQPTKS